ncbi:uncharacterized protein LOC119169432 isoform X2 [Rhipicephalus microplus]|uniref:uncharacterized protein LOC119169432 isoform X2 n=2 Tax=Rhipicephalus microplus TaxID=6941 RepID=UPI003F6B9B5E
MTLHRSGKMTLHSSKLPSGIANMRTSSGVASLILFLAYGLAFSAKHNLKQRHQKFCQGPKPRDNCTCYIEGQKQNYPDGRACYVKFSGYNDELDYKEGTCKSERCLYTNISYGCKHVDEKRKKRMKLGDQVGCAFTCYNRETKTKEFAYYYEGAPCLHAVGPGNYTKGTCVKAEDKMICHPIKAPLSC